MVGLAVGMGVVVGHDDALGGAAKILVELAETYLARSDVGQEIPGAEVGAWLGHEGIALGIEQAPRGSLGRCRSGISHLDRGGVTTLAFVEQELRRAA